jgi:predicted phosphodiesterase
MILHKQFSEIVAELESPINEEDLRSLEEEYIAFIEDYIKETNRKIFKEIKTKERIVVVGDIHNDSVTLHNVFKKLEISKEYDYAKNAVFVFLGDYLDRGANSLQVLRFILKFKKLLSQRCILLKGNHDDIKYSDDKGFYALHEPHDTLDFIKGLFNEITIHKIKEFYELLPYFALAEINNTRILFTHASIPKDIYFEKFDLKSIGDKVLPINERDDYFEMLFGMTWGDPANVEMKYQNKINESRFEFGKNQFNKFMDEVNFDIMFRGHSALSDGYGKYFNDKLISIFSSGGNF